MRILSTILLTSALCAQGVTSPRGLDTTEGNASFVHFGGSRRFQQIDYSQAGGPLVISSISWRRNGGSTGAAGTRTFDFQVDLGRGDFGAISFLLDSNYLAGTKTTVFNQTAVVFPDWSASIPGPAPFDFKVMLGSPYVYTGANALVIDFYHTNSSTSGTLSVDREFTGPTTPTTGIALGTGCVATGNVSAFAHTAYMANQDSMPTPLYGMRYRLGGTNAPLGGGVVALMDSVNPNLGGLLCTTVYSGGLVALPLPSIPGTTTVPELSLGFTYSASLLGVTLFTQLAALDLGQGPIPVVLSNGRQTTMPATTTYLNSPRCSYGWTSLPTTTGSATHFVGGGMVMLLQ
jgi:hypothetical protein